MQLVAQDDEIPRRFPNGIFSFSLGDGEINQTVETLKFDLKLNANRIPADPLSLTTVATALSDVLGDTRSLLIFDDVQSRNQMRPFMGAAFNCVRLISTRYLSAIPKDSLRIILEPIVPDRSIIKPPPDIPFQGIGPHVEIDLEGVIRFPPPESLDINGNYLPRLSALHPGLCELACELAADLRVGNAAHAMLGARIEAYAVLINRSLDTVDFRRLYAAGVRMANASHAAKQAISRGDLPDLEPSAQEKLESLLDLHGPFIMATASGIEAISDEDRFQRRPEEQRQYRADAITLLQTLENRSDLVALDLVEQVTGAVRDIDSGSNPERSTIVGSALNYRGKCAYAKSHHRNCERSDRRRVTQFHWTYFVRRRCNSHICGSISF